MNDALPPPDPDLLPASARLAWWGTAWLRGHVVSDLMIDAVFGADATHVVSGLDALGLGRDLDLASRPGDLLTAQTFLSGLGRLRVMGATAFGAAFPVEGDPVGLGGPRTFNAEALDVGEAVIVEGIGVGLVPLRTGAAVSWAAHPAERRQLPDVGEADRTLRTTLLQTADALARLEVARWRPEVADRLMNLRHLHRLPAPPGVPPRCVDLAARGLQAVEIVDVALEDDGGVLSAHEVFAREDALRPLARAGRRALVAACSPEVWPPS